MGSFLKTLAAAPPADPSSTAPTRMSLFDNLREAGYWSSKFRGFFMTYFDMSQGMQASATAEV